MNIEELKRPRFLPLFSFVFLFNFIYFSIQHVGVGAEAFEDAVESCPPVQVCAIGSMRKPSL